MPQVNQFLQQLIQPFKRLGSNHNPRAYTQGLIPYRQKQWSQAVEYFTQATAEQPDHASSYFKLGMSHFRLKEYEAALGNITKALDIDPSQKQWQAQLEQATHYISRKKGINSLDKKQLILEQLKRLDTPSADLYNQLAHVYKKQGENLKEIEALQKAVMLEDKNPTWFYRLGEAFELINQFHNASIVYEKAIALKEDGVKAYWYYRLGYCLEKESKHESLIKGQLINAYDKAISIDKSLNAKRYGIGVFHQSDGEWVEAAESYKKEFEQQPLDEELCYRIAVAYELSSNWLDAELYYKKALMLESGRPAWHFRLGLVLERQEKYEEAFEAYQYAIFISNSKKPYWIYRAASVKRLQSDYKFSSQLYMETRNQKTIEKQIDEVNVINENFDKDLISSYIGKINNNEEISQALTDRITDDSENSKLWYQLGKNHEKGGRWADAANAYLNAINKSSGFSRYWLYRLGYTLNHMTEYKKACDYFSLMMDSSFNSYYLKNKLNCKVANIDFSENVYSIEVVVSCDREITECVVESLTLDARESFDKEKKVLILEKHKIKKKGNNIHCFFKFDAFKNEFGFLYHDLFLDVRVTLKDFIDVSIKVKNSLATLDMVNKLKNYPLSLSYKSNGMIFYPYVTASGKSVAFINREANIYDSDYYNQIEIDSIEEFEKNKHYHLEKKAWLIFEKFSKTAQDNSYYFFMDIVNKRPNVYYVIEKDSPDRKYLTGYEDNVVEFMSKEHMLLLLSCELMISSETRGHVYAWRRVFGKFREAVFKKPYVFLQHGVTAMKKNDVNLAKTSHICAADKFVVSCDFEKNIILRDNFGYSESDLIVSGFPRWNTFIDKSEEFNEIFIMPTWRNWLEGMQENEFKETDYFKEYTDLLSSESLREILIDYDYKVNFYLHPKIIEQLKNFDKQHDRINLIQFGESSVRELLMRSKLLITDYSSVAWDFYYLKKPVIFFHFDEQKYLKYHGSHIDFSSELPAKAVKSGCELINEIDNVLRNYSKSKNESENIGEGLFGKVMNTNSSDTIYRVLVKLNQ
ncbi:CDP-glycerol glycerophosphotransferase family protein [Halomonas sp. MC140]|nr:CDP-glycerol glycerophosphotransferase family protein [Halomonas sp. MC140]MDN7131954.1 CDP-glycerol glycerophosphotransferase family protein [Halomonas sp. MC140]